jgi:hypothetical protein
VGVLVGLLATGASGAELSVTDPGDTLPGGTSGQLRRAITDAADGDVIVIRVSQPIVLAGGAVDDTNAAGDLDIIGKAISIQGRGPAQTIVDGGGLSRVFHVLPGAGLFLSGMTVRGGVDFAGGGIFNEGTMALTSVEVVGNHASFGGGVANSGLASLTMTGVTLAGNTADVNGGGLSISSGSVTLVNTTVSGNSAKELGGGVNVFGGSTSLTSVTITDNSADSDSTAPPGQGGGISGFGSTTIRDTIVAGNRVGSSVGSDGPDCAFALNSLGSNLVQNLAGCAVGGVISTNISGVAPGLGPLGANGGPTRTHALLTGSPALEAGDGACAATDQRGVLRPQGERCDIGAFEKGPAAPLAVDFDGDGHADVVVGAGRGVEPRVRVLSGASGAELLTFLAYDTPARASSGVRVAACDLTGDGVPDIVTAPGGGPVLVRAFDGTTGAPLPGALGGFTVPALTGRGPGATVTCADVSGDGVPDILVGLPAGPGGESQVLTFSGVDGSALGQVTALPGVGGEVFLAP